MKTNTLKINHHLPLIRKRLLSFVPEDSGKCFSDILTECERRGLMLWNQEIVPDLDIKSQRNFEHELSKVGIRAGLTIPSVFANGYAFGMACHQMIDGDPDQRTEAASNCGLLFFLLGLLDHLYDEYPDIFVHAQQLFDADAIKRWTIERNFSDLVSPDNVIANGILQLYKVYFKRCHRLLDSGDNVDMISHWSNAICEMHALEKASAERRISRIKADKKLIEQSRQLTLKSAIGLSLSVCLSEGENSFNKLDAFVKDYATLLWYVDDITDLEKDIQNDIWSALAVRLKLEADTEQDVDNVVFKVIDEMGELVKNIYQYSGAIKWDDKDDFLMADIFWADIWRWLRGDLTIRAAV